MSMHGSMADDPTDELSHNPFLSEARDEQPEQSPQRHQQHASASVPTGPLSSSTMSASAADPLSQSQGGQPVHNAASSSSAVMQQSASQASHLTNGHDHDQHADESMSAQPSLQQQPVRPRPTRLALKDNADWKDEIKIIDAEKTREGSTSSFIQYILRSDVGKGSCEYLGATDRMRCRKETRAGVILNSNRSVPCCRSSIQSSLSRPYRLTTA